MDIRTRERDSTVVLDVAGRLTAGAGADQLRGTITQLAGAGKKRVLLNLQDVVFMDSTGLGSLVATSEILRRQGGNLRVVNARGPVRHVFQITRLNKVFPDYQDEDSALASFSA
jgi:anti-sigma B factor antagonist